MCGICGNGRDCWTVDDWAEVLAPLLDVFEPGSTSHPSLFDALEADWMVFSRKPQGKKARARREEFVIALASATSPSRSLSAGVRLRDEAVARPKWEEFRETIAKKRRWLGSSSREIVEDIELAITLRPERLWPKSRPLYRARVCTDARSPLSFKEMGPPLPALATAGRANVAGIPVLYAAKTMSTAVYECRPTRGSTVAVGEFKARLGALRLLDLTQGARRLQNPFDEGGGSELNKFRRAMELGDLIGEAFSRPTRSGDDIHDYVATQFVAEYIAEQGFDGVIYDSSFSDSVGNGGANVVVFDPSRVTVVRKRPRHVLVTGVEWRIEDAIDTRA